MCGAHTGAEASSLGTCVACPAPSMPSPGDLMPSSALLHTFPVSPGAGVCLPDAITSTGHRQGSAGGAVPCRPVQHLDIGSFLLLLASPGCPPHIGVWAPGWAKCTLARQINIRLPALRCVDVFLCSCGEVGGWHWDSCSLQCGRGALSSCQALLVLCSWHWSVLLPRGGTGRPGLALALCSCSGAGFCCLPQGCLLPALEYRE